MESSNNKGLVSSYVMVRFFLNKLFEENLIDTDTYWGIYLDNYLGGDIYATPFYAVEWITVNGRTFQK